MISRITRSSCRNAHEPRRLLLPGWHSAGTRSRVGDAIFSIFFNAPLLPQDIGVAAFEASARRLARFLVERALRMIRRRLSVARRQRGGMAWRVGMSHAP